MTYKGKVVLAGTIVSRNDVIARRAALKKVGRGRKKKAA
jgi:hypothetical protein